MKEEDIGVSIILVPKIVSKRTIKVGFFIKLVGLYLFNVNLLKR